MCTSLDLRCAAEGGRSEACCEPRSEARAALQQFEPSDSRSRESRSAVSSCASRSASLCSSASGAYGREEDEEANRWRSRAAACLVRARAETASVASRSAAESASSNDACAEGGGEEFACIT
eukprot:scaffold274353_cov30-Tisochrysis_lutea.AAC.7